MDVSVGFVHGWCSHKGKVAENAGHESKGTIRGFPLQEKRVVPVPKDG